MTLSIRPTAAHRIIIALLAMYTFTLLAAPCADALPAGFFPTTKAEVVEAAARAQLGKPYVANGASPNIGFDCSGFTMFVYSQIGITLPHYSADQYSTAKSISGGRLSLATAISSTASPLRRGDLIFFTDVIGGTTINHVAIFLGGTGADRFLYIHSSDDVGKVNLKRLDDGGTLAKRLYGYRRFF